VQQQGEEKQYCRQHGECQDETVAPRGIPGMKLSGQRENNQECDDEPAVVQADFDAEDAPEFDLGTHVNTSELRCSTPEIDH
jgi:hypothetical protein